MTSAEKNFPKTTEKLVKGQENNNFSVLNLYSSLKTPIVIIGIEKIHIKNKELKNPLTSAIPIFTLFKKNNSPDIEKNMLKKIYPTGFKK